LESENEKGWRDDSALVSSMRDFARPTLSTDSRIDWLFCSQIFSAVLWAKISGVESWKVLVAWYNPEITRFLCLQYPDTWEIDREQKGSRMRNETHSGRNYSLLLQ
jgi:hypothetical protein